MVHCTMLSTFEYLHILCALGLMPISKHRKTIIINKLLALRYIDFDWLRDCLFVILNDQFCKLQLCFWLKIDSDLAFGKPRSSSFSYSLPFYHVVPLDLPKCYRIFSFSSSKVLHITYYHCGSVWNTENRFQHLRRGSNNIPIVQVVLISFGRQRICRSDLCTKTDRDLRKIQASASLQGNKHPYCTECRNNNVNIRCVDRWRIAHCIH